MIEININFSEHTLSRVTSSPRREFGDVTVDIEQKKKEDRSLGLTSMNVSQFLSLYKDKELYVVDSIQEEMKREFVTAGTARGSGY